MLVNELPPPGIDVIVPVRGAGRVFARCAASLVRHMPRATAAASGVGAATARRSARGVGSVRLIVVLDGPPDAESLAAIADLEAAGLDLTVLRHPQPLGFVISVNRAMRGTRPIDQTDATGGTVGADATAATDGTAGTGGTYPTDRDVVLLNSDTQVTAGWLDGLAAAAYSDPSIATVTPFSNNATICSLPRFLDENTVPAGYALDTFAALVAHVSRREYPRLPTGVGACLYIKRRVLDEIGLFDEAFGLGYGEEIDFCRRATRRGYVHVLDDGTYIFHEGARSFGRSRERRIPRAERTLRARYPEFRRELGEFIRRDPLAPARARVMAALQIASQVVLATRSAEEAAEAAAEKAAETTAQTAAEAASTTTPSIGGGRIVHLVHGWPPWSHGGTEMYAYWLALHQHRGSGSSHGRSREVFVYARIADPDRVFGDAVEHVDRGGVRVRLIVNNFVQRNPLSRFGLHSGRIAADFGKFLDEVRPDVLHVHHLVGHCASLLAVAHARGIPIVYQVQDWWALCARANLIDRRESLCTGPGPMKCARCLPMTPLPAFTLVNPLLYAARRWWIRKQLAKTRAFVMGSHFIERSYAAARLLPVMASAAIGSRVATGTAVPAMTHVLPYGVPPPMMPTMPSTKAPPAAASVARADDAAQADAGGRPLRFGYIGSLHPHKGVHVAVEAFSRIDPARAQLHVWGDGDNAAYRARLAAAASAAPAVVFHGGFPESAKSDILRTFDVLIVPSIGLESYGLAAREAMAHGVPVLASRLGALTELFDDTGPIASTERAAPPDAHPADRADAADATGASRRTSISSRTTTATDSTTSSSATSGARGSSGNGGSGSRGAANDGNGGDFFEAGDAEALASWIARLVADPSQIARWRRALPAVPSVSDHAEAIERIYAEVMKPSAR